MSWEDDAFTDDWDDGPEGFADHAEDWGSTSAFWEQEGDSGGPMSAIADQDDFEREVDEAYVSGWRDGWEDGERPIGNAADEADERALAGEFSENLSGANHDELHDAFDQLGEFFDEWGTAQLEDDNRRDADESDQLQHPEDTEADRQDDEDEHRHDTGPGTK